MKTISVQEAKRLLADGAQLYDIRGADEHARERIPGASNRPVDQIDTIENATGPILFHCRSGQRTAAHAARLSQAARCEAYIVEGGIEAWKKAGLPIVRDTKQPIEIQRQVQIAAGSLVLAGLLLGWVVSPIFVGLSGLVGAGLVFAGVTGWCGMAKLFVLMPWNRQPSGLGAGQVS